MDVGVWRVLVIDKVRVVGVGVGCGEEGEVGGFCGSWEGVGLFLV